MITALIPARVGSKRLPNKNFRMFCGKPLLEWSILCALKCELIDKVIVSTDNDDYVYDHPKVIIDYRDDEMRHYEVNTDTIFRYLEKKYEIEGIKVILLPTCPLRIPHTIEAMINLHQLYHKTIVSVKSTDLIPNGVCIVYEDTIYDGELIPFECNVIESIDIDEDYEFRIAEYYFKEYYFKGVLK